MKLLKAALLATAFALPLAPATWAATPADTLVVAQNIDDIVAIDPAQAYEFSSGELVTNVYDRLVQYDAEDTTVLAPGLATEWEADDASKTITFTMREGVSFHSGNPVRPEDVVFSFRRVVELNLTPAFILTQLGWTAENIGEMVTVDGNNVVVRYEGDFSSAFVLNVLAARPASIVDELTVMANEVEGDMGNAFAYNSDNSDENYQATTTWRNAWAVPEELNEMTNAALAEADPEARNEIYLELQRRVQESSPIVIMFQATYQVAMAANVEGYVNGATSDFVFYRLVTKD